MPRIPRRELTITDAFMFDRVMRDESICKGLLERVLGIRIDRIVYQNTEQVLDPLADAKGVQLDLYLKDDERVYDVEVQVRRKPDLARRLRYYQSVIDSDLLPKGAAYGQLRERGLLTKFRTLKEGILSCFPMRNECVRSLFTINTIIPSRQ